MKLVVAAIILLISGTPAWGQTVSGVRGFGGGVAPLFNIVGPGNLYIDNQGAQGYMYTFNTFESYNFRNPATGQAWAGAVMTLGPQLSIGVIQGANQIGSPVVLIPPPSQPGGVAVSSFSLTVPSGLAQAGVPSTPVIGTSVVGATVQPVRLPISLLLRPPQPRAYPSPLDIESSLLEIP